MLPEARVWHGMWKDKGFEMLHKDIDAINVWNRERYAKDMQPQVEDMIKKETHDGVLDFHALRTTFGTMLSQAGVQLITAQKLMRHHDPKLTANFYTRVVLQDKESAIGKLPSTKTANEAVAEAKTGTSDAPEKSFGTAAATKITDTPTDTRTPYFYEHLRTFPDCGELRKAAGAEGMSDEKSPENGGFSMFPRDSGPCEYWGEKWDSNPRPSEPQSAGCHSQPQEAQGIMATSNSGGHTDGHKDQNHVRTAIVKFPELLEVIRVWDKLSPELRQAIRSIIRPYP